MSTWIQTAIGATQVDTYVRSDESVGCYVVEVRLMSFDHPGGFPIGLGKATYRGMNRHVFWFGSLEQAKAAALERAEENLNSKLVSKVYR